MSIGRRLLGILLFALFAVSCVVFSQDKNTKDAIANAVDASNRAEDDCAHAPNIQILTDTMGVDFGPYLQQVNTRVRGNWYNLLPPSVYLPILQKGVVTLEFAILKDGNVAGLMIDRRSGDVALDRAALGSITTSNPFLPLPHEFVARCPTPVRDVQCNLGLRYNYFYNLPRRLPISISPCANVQVPAGSTLKFSVLGKGITDTSVKWSVSGPGCSQAACGTISDKGIYTAPVDIPNPPTVIVEATSPSDTSIPPGMTTLAVVKANPSH